MLFGTSIYKLNKLNAQHQLTNVNMRLNRAKKTIKNLQNALTAQKNFQLSQLNLEKASLLDSCLRGMGATQPGAGASIDVINIYQQQRSEAIARVDSYIAMRKAEIENQFEEANTPILESSKNEEEDLTIESSYWKEMVEYWSEMIKQAEEWFRDSLRDLFGGGHGR